MSDDIDSPEGNEGPDPAPVKLPAGMEAPGPKVLGPTGAPSDATIGTMAVPPRMRVNSDGVEVPDDLVDMFTQSGQRIRNRIWALIRDGVVVAKRMTRHATFHPFTDEEMEPRSARAIDVSNTDCQVGYLADEKGNVTPPGTRTMALPPGQPAYHDMHLVAPPTSQETALKFGLAGMTGGKDAEEMAGDQADGPPIGRGSTLLHHKDKPEDADLSAKENGGEPEGSADHPPVDPSRPSYLDDDMKAAEAHPAHQTVTNPAPPPPPKPAEGETSAAPPPPPPPSFPTEKE